MEKYLSETLMYMRHRESKLPTFKRKSPQFDRRRVLVDWTCTSGESLEFPKSTIHLAIVLLDRFMDGHHIDLKSLHFVCLSCLSIAGKFDMKECKTLKFSRLKVVLDDSTILPSSEFRRLEGMILAHFKWNIFIPTPTHFVDLLYGRYLQPTDLVGGFTMHKNFSEILDCLTDFIKYFLDISMQVRAIDSFFTTYRVGQRKVYIPMYTVSALIQWWVVFFQWDFLGRVLFMSRQNFV